MDSWTVVHQSHQLTVAPPPMEFSRQEYWSGLPFPSPGDLPNTGIKPRSPALWEDALLSEPPGNLSIYADYIMQNARPDESQARIKTARINIYNLRYEDYITLMAGSEEELKNLLIRVKQESENASLKLNMKNTKIMAYSPITSWQIEKVEAVTYFLSWAPKSL